MKRRIRWYFFIGSLFLLVGLSTASAQDCYEDIYRTFSIKKGGSVVYRGRTYSQAGVFTDTIYNISGCDTLVHIYVNFSESYHFYDTVRQCGTHPYTWRGKTITQSGNYFDSLLTVETRVDSIYQLHMVMFTPQPQYDTLTICEHELPYIFYDQIITQAGDYYYHGLNPYGCSVEHYLHLLIAPTPFTTVNVTFCQGDGISHRGGPRFYDARTFFDTIPSFGLGCDSIIRTIYMPLSTYLFDKYATHTSGQPYYWSQTGQSYTKDGLYYDSLLTVGGCDSVYVLHLSTTYAIPVIYNQCQGDTAYYHERIITQTTTFTDTLHSVLGADSVLLITYNFYPKYYFTERTTICSNERVEWEGHTDENGNPIILHQPGIYYDKKTSKTGCDSIYKIEVSVSKNWTFDTLIVRTNESLPFTYRDSHGVEHQWFQPNVDTVFIDTLGRTPMGKESHQGNVWYRVLSGGCDSIWSMRIVTKPMGHDTLPLCPGSEVWIHDHKYTQPGDYTIEFCTGKLGNVNDSVCQYHVYLAQVYDLHYYDTARICQSETPYFWHSLAVTQSGNYSDTLRTKHRCDSVVHLHIEVLPTYYAEELYNLCLGDTLWVRNRLFTKPGIYYDSLLTRNGCDSVTQIVINQVRSYHFTETQYLGVGGTYTWHKEGAPRILTKPGVYFDSCRTVVDGCDSIYTLTLLRANSYLFQETAHVCSNDLPYRWRGKTLNHEGIHWDSLQSRFGMDSVYSMQLYIDTTSLTDLYLTMCSSERWVLRGRIITQSGVYHDTLTNQVGCDSIIRYHINFMPAYQTLQHASFCMNEPYVWHRGSRPDTVLTQPGVYRDRYISVLGCDSIYELQLSALPYQVHDTTIYVCEDELPYYVAGQAYHSSQVFRDTLSNQYGCDSIRIVRYHVAAFCSPLDNYYHCAGTPAIVDGKIIKEDGSYRWALTQDSIHRFTVATLPSYDYTKNIGAYCDSVEYEGVMYYARGAGHETFTIDRHMRTYLGCDSIERVTMTIYQSAPPTVWNQQIYDYSYLVFGGEAYRSTGIYTRNFHTSHNCDSVVTLNLTVTPTDHTGSLLYYYCEGAENAVVFHGKTYRPSSDTTILDTTYIPLAGMFIVSQLQVLVEHTFYITKLEPQHQVCADNDIRFQVGYDFMGVDPATYELEFLQSDLSVSPRVQSGNVDPASHSVAVSMSGLGKCVRPGYYPYRLTLKGNRCHLSDTTIESTIMVRYPASVMQGNWTNVVALVNEDYNVGAWHFLPPYSWQVWDRFGDDKTAWVLPPDPSQPYIYSDRLERGDQVVVTLTREGYPHAIPSCEYTFIPTEPTGLQPVLVYPTSVACAQRITLEAASSGVYTLYDRVGRCCGQGQYTSGTQSVAVPSVAGYYVLLITSADGSTQTQSIIVY